MTRKHYKLIAGALLPYAGTAAHAPIALALARVLAGDNPRFNRERFLRACGLNNPTLPLH